MKKKDELTPSQEDILKYIVGYGGYATKEILHLYRKDRSEKTLYQNVLLPLWKMNYLKKVDYFLNPQQPTVYQVTKKACRIWGREESHMRRKHADAAIRRYLGRSHFLFLMKGRGANIELFSPISRKEYLNSIGLGDDMLPQKINRGISKVQIEEYIVTQNGLKFIYIDDPTKEAMRQLKNLFEKYLKVINTRDKTGFIIVAETLVRANVYSNLIELIGEKMMEKIELSIIYFDRIYAKTCGVEYSDVRKEEYLLYNGQTL